MDIYLTIFLITAVTGAGGLALGGGLAAMVHSPSDRTVSLLLRFTAGVMLSVVCFDLIADAMEESGALPVLCWIMIGYLCTYLLNCWIDKQAHHTHSHSGHGEEHDHRHGHEHTHEHEHVHEENHRPHLGTDNGELCACGSHTLHTAGLVLAVAVALHNMPVGMAIGATFAGVARGGGILAALIIGLHNIPEGMSIAAPLLAGGSRPAAAVGVAALSGLPTILGALLGYGAGTMNPLLLAISLSFAAGAMLYVIFGELLPEGEHLWQNRLSGLSTMLGMLLGMALIFAHIH
ncbi:MAG: ZIP family metal transporter [Oscillibacter sp.]|nr:ZIP family metal transporter [Oscillibacter sp.]